MITYGDTRVCPGCRETLPEGTRLACPRCELPLQHPLAGELLSTLRRADQLVDNLYALRTAAPAPVAAFAPATRPYPDHPPLDTERPARTGVRTSSVPSILLAAGGLCLAVAAIIFLAVAWSRIGVGGRTSVLVLLTLGATAGAVLLERHRLRAAAETAGSVAAVLLALDVLGADSAGWLGTRSVSGVALVVGVALVLHAAGVLGAARRLVSPQLIGALGLLVVAQATFLVTDESLAVPALATVLVLAVSVGARRLELTALRTATLGVAAISWVELVLVGLGRLDVHDLTWSSVWVHGPGAALGVAVLLTLLPALPDRRDATLVTTGAVAGSLLTGLLALPALDDGLTSVALAALAAATAWLVVRLALGRVDVGRVAPGRYAGVAGLPAVLSGLPLGVIVLGLVDEAITRVLTPDAALRLPDAAPLAAPWLLVPGVVVLLGVAAALRPGGSARSARSARGAQVAWIGRGARGGVAVAAVVVLLAAVATLALEPVPLWTVVASLLAIGLGLGAVAVRSAGAAGLVTMPVSVVVAGAALGASDPSATLLTASAAVLVVLSAGSLVGRFDHAAVLGGALLPLSTGILLTALADRLDVVPAHVGVPILVVTGLLAILRPRVEVELATAAVWAAAAGAALSATSASASGDLSLALAVHLSVAGALVTVTSLLHPSRRPLAVLGGVLLVLATWVRLAELGVHAPEAYTLPTAAVLLVAGLVRLVRDDDAATSTSLTPGLVLATVPSLLWAVAVDPVSLRAVLLGLACLALVLSGGVVRWSAPLLVGALVGGVLVLAELAPYAGVVPQWVLIGAAGTLLTGVGITWESRLTDVHRASVALARLR